MSTKDPIRVPPQQRAALLREEIRNSIPISRYVSMLHEALSTGRLPDLDPLTGKPLGSHIEITARDRIDIMKYLVNKVLPDKPEPNVLLLTRDDVLRMSPEQIRSLPADQLVEALRLAGTPPNE